MIGRLNRIGWQGFGAEIVNTSPSTQTVTQPVRQYSLSTAALSSILSTYIGQPGTVTTVTQCQFAAPADAGMRQAAAAQNAIVSAIVALVGRAPSTGEKIQLTTSERTALLTNARALAIRELASIGSDVAVMYDGVVVVKPTYCT